MGEWIENQGGALLPAGTVVDLEFEDGDTLFGFVAQTEGRFETSQGYWFSSVPDFSWPRDYDGLCVGRYRLSDTDDKAKREARMELFRGIAKSKEFLIEETLKPREKVK